MLLIGFFVSIAAGYFLQPHVMKVRWSKFEARREGLQVTMRHAWQDTCSHVVTVPYERGAAVGAKVTYEAARMCKRCGQDVSAKMMDTSIAANDKQPRQHVADGAMS